MPKSLASLSLDLDNKWSYMKTHGDAGWEAYPSYLDLVVPRALGMLAERDLTITFFVVGRDASRDENAGALASLSAAGHEIGNHSFEHEPWLHLYSESELDEELAKTEEHVERVTGECPVGFRGPGFSFSPTLLRVLARRGYEYDASTFPTYLGPLARAFYFATAKLDDEQREERRQLFGKFSEGFRPLKPYHWDLGDDGRLLEIPVTTLPLFKVPIHASYLLYLGQFSRWTAMAYWRTALAMCRLCGVQPSLLLHPLDFLGGDDDADLAFFPAMGRPAAEKLRLMGWILDTFAGQFDVVPMREHARLAATTTRSRPVSRESGDSAGTPNRTHATVGG